MARDVIVATFENRNQAYDTAREIDKLDEAVIKVQAGAIVEKDMLGNVSLLDSRELDTAWGGLGGLTAGGLLGALVGALAGPAGAAVGAASGSLLGGTLGATVDIADTGLKEDYIGAVSGRLVPGHAALVAEVDEYSTQPVDEVVWRNGGVIFRQPSTYAVA